MIFTTRLLAPVLTAALLSAPALAQTTDNSGHDMSQADHSKMNMDDMQQGDMKNMNMDHEAIMKARAVHMVEATGAVKEINKKDRLVSLAHGGIPAISWPPMTMKFPAGEAIDLDGFNKGQRVQFTLHRAVDGSLPLAELCPTTSADVIAGLCAPSMDYAPETSSHDNKPHPHGDH